MFMSLCKRTRIALWAILDNFPERTERPVCSQFMRLFVHAFSTSFVNHCL